MQEFPHPKTISVETKALAECKNMNVRQKSYSLDKTRAKSLMKSGELRQGRNIITTGKINVCTRTSMGRSYPGKENL